MHCVPTRALAMPHGMHAGMCMGTRVDIRLGICVDICMGIAFVRPGLCLYAHPCTSMPMCRHIYFWDAAVHFLPGPTKIRITIDAVCMNMGFDMDTDMSIDICWT